MRILGLDIGSKTIGVAVSDEMGWTAQGVTTLYRGSRDETYQELFRYMKEYQVERLVVGLPLHMNGTEGKEALAVRQFVEEFQKSCLPESGSPGSGFSELPVIYYDERMSTMAAERGLLEADLSREKRKKVINKMAAVFILQGYLDSQQGAR